MHKLSDLFLHRVTKTVWSSYYGLFRINNEYTSDRNIYFSFNCQELVALVMKGGAKTVLARPPLHCTYMPTFIY